MNTSRVLKAGSGEKTQYMVHDFNDNTIRFVLHYPGIVDPDTLCAAAKALAGSVDILHASFCADKIGARWLVNEEYGESSFFRFVRTQGDPSPTANSLALLPIPPQSQAQMRCWLVQSDTAGCVVLSLSHLCVDGGDGKYLLNKLAEAYNLLLAEGTAEKLAVKNGNRAAQQVFENVNLKDYLSLMTNPISQVKSEFPYPTQQPGRLRMVSAVIPAPVMSAARQRGKSIGATANDILLAACYHAYGALPGVDGAAPMSIMSMMDLRRHCENGESEGLCNMSGSLPTLLPDGLPGQMPDTLALVAAQTRAAKENPLAGLEGMPLVHGATRALPMALLLKIAGKVYGSFSVGLTNLGNVPCAPLALGGLSPDGGLFGGPLKKKPAMQISAISFDGACSLSIVGQYTEEDGRALQSMLDHIAAQVGQYAEG